MLVSIVISICERLLVVCYIHSCNDALLYVSVHVLVCTILRMFTVETSSCNALRFHAN